jgi:hypothetical protein
MNSERSVCIIEHPESADETNQRRPGMNERLVGEMLQLPFAGERNRYSPEAINASPVALVVTT